MSGSGVELSHTRIAYMTLGRAAIIDFEADPENLRPLQTGYRRGLLLLRIHPSKNALKIGQICGFHMAL